MSRLSWPFVATWLLVASCGGAHSPLASAGKTEPPNVQDEALSDGKVTLAEYQAGFARWVQCAKDVGITVEAESTDPLSGQFQFRIYDPGKLEDDSNPAAKCYRETFALVDKWFGANDPVVQAQAAEEQRALFREKMVPCLRQNGEPAGSEAQPGDEEWIRVLERAAALQSAGKC